MPLCLAAALLAPRVLDERRDPDAPPLDLAGALLATSGLASLVLAFTLLARGGPALPALAAAIVLLTAFALVEARAAHPLLDRAILRRPGVLGPNAVAAVLTATTGPAIFSCTLHAQQVLHIPAATTGLLFAPVNLAVIAGSLLGPRAVARSGPRLTMAGGLHVELADVGELAGAAEAHSAETQHRDTQS